MSQPQIEVWANLEGQMRWWRIISIVAVLLAGVTTVSAMSLWKQRVVVVHLKDNGKTDIAWTTPVKSAVTQQEIIDFTEEFLNVYLAPSSDKISQNLTRALAMMSEALKQRHAQFADQSDYVRRVQAMHVETELRFSNFLVEPKNEEAFNVFAAGQQRSIGRSGAAVFHPFKGMIVVKKITRSEFNPYGLEVAYLDYEIKKE